MDNTIPQRCKPTRNPTNVNTIIEARLIYEQALGALSLPMRVEF